MRFNKISGKWYALNIEDIEDDLENIKQFTSEGVMVVFADNIEDFVSQMEYVDSHEVEIIE